MFFLLSIVLFSSCQKDASVDPSPSKDELVTKVNAWMDARIAAVTGDRATKAESIKSNLDFGAMRLEPYRLDEKLLVVPVRSSFRSANNQGKDPVNYLLLVVSRGNVITSGNLIQYVAAAGQSKTVPANTFSDIFNYRNVQCDGLFTVLNVYDDFLYELKFENKKLKSVAEKRKRIDTGAGRLTMECTDWYLVTTIYYDDGSTEVYETYIGRTCHGDGEVQVPSGDGGGGYVEYIYAVATKKDWIVAESTSGFWYVFSTERFTGEKNVNEQPSGGHFTGVTHLGSTISAVSTNYTWSQAGATTSYTSTVATAIVSGTVTHNGSLPGSVFFPVLHVIFHFKLFFHKTILCEFHETYKQCQAVLYC
ncbi:MAG: hypothetical protein JNN00_18260 [Chitinophagaceae bacterium]|nr:hypothetical protein [Chitinophagaceae bacterium]